MSKDRKQQMSPAASNESVTPSPAPEVAAPAAPAVPAPQEAATDAAPPAEAAPQAEASSQGTELVPVAATEAPLAPVSEVMNLEKPFNVFRPGAFKDLIELFPEDTRYLRNIEPVTDDELNAAIDTHLTGAPQSAFREALDRMNPVKLGSHSRRADAWATQDIKIYHGTGNDEMRPKGTPDGGIYSRDGRLLATMDKDLAAALRAPERFEAYVLVDFRGNTYWGPDAGEGEESKARSPICRSVDGIMGTEFGACASCNVRPFKNGSKPEEDECIGEVVLYVVPRDFSGVYKWVFNKTNAKPGRAIIKQYASWRANWQHPFSFGTKKEVSADGKRRWFVTEAQPMRSVQPSAGENNFLTLLARKIDTELYWPSRRLITLMARNPKPQANKANTAGLLAKSREGLPASTAPVASGAAPGALPDLSRGNNI